MTNPLDLTAHFRPLWDINDQSKRQFPEVRPLVAHYCSTSTLEAMVRNNEIWFSNPLYMNDYEELRFGLRHSRAHFRACEALRTALSDMERYEFFRNYVEAIFEQFEQGLSFDIYMVCFSEHDPADSDGRLSMWRGYGANGSGAAVIFNTAVLTEVPDSPIRLTRVTYGTSDQRIGWIDEILNTFASLLPAVGTSDQALQLSALHLFERLLMLSICTKHSGFEEEKEWRAIYFRHADVKNLLVPQLGYHVNGATVEPKLKWKVGAMNNVAAGEVSLDRLIVKIILGPTGVSALSKMAVQRMLNTLDRPALSELVVTSTTPYRAR